MANPVQQFRYLRGRINYRFSSIVFRTTNNGKRITANEQRKKNGLLFDNYLT
jgi:hypothetical protein